ncbi:GIY-YIG nuclease family protein [Luteibaculum oceani]|uniref:GIY-YIG nuclease family protein n=1 Tax=Luteibaculum oceani TaxID=1294296 RepID=A0A5C6VLN5_9FLAO|nr:GIY-YIG nuclease family protein [Luteibaculum oceani]
MHYLYIIYSPCKDLYYVGESSHPWNRLSQHNETIRTKYTNRAHDWELKAVFKITNKSEARKIENFIKRQKSRPLILRLCDPDFIPEGRLAQLVRVPQLRD